MTKGGPATINPGQLGQFTLNVQNTGNSDAWNATIVDKLPTGTTGGMCNTAPQVLSAQVFQADGITPVAGKGPLTAGTDYTLSYAGAPACTLTLNMLSAAAVNGPTPGPKLPYRTQHAANTSPRTTRRPTDRWHPEGRSTCASAPRSAARSLPARSSPTPAS